MHTRWCAAFAIADFRFGKGARALAYEGGCTHTHVRAHMRVCERVRGISDLIVLG